MSEPLRLRPRDFQEKLPTNHTEFDFLRAEYERERRQGRPERDEILGTFDRPMKQLLDGTWVPK